MAKKQTKQELSTAQKVGLGMGLTAAAVAAAGAYFLYGAKEAPKNRKKVKGWMLKAKGEVLEALEKANKISEAEYKALVDTATAAYGAAKRASAGDIKDFKHEMLEHWSNLQKSGVIEKTAKEVKKGISNMKAVSKPSAKKAAKAAPKKKAPAKK